MLNEEIRESADFAGGGDDTFNDVVQEFSQMVYTHPERLNKKSSFLPEEPSKKWTEIVQPKFYNLLYAMTIKYRQEVAIQ